jgi:gliding-associated putative ABC transporter substrate-binding component GldG
MAITQKQRQLAISSAAGVLLFGLVLILVNILANWVYLRFDLTRHHSYSLSPASRKLVRSLDEPVVIKVFYTPELPSPYNTYGRYLKDVLAEYKSASHGRVRAEFVPAQPAQAFETHAMEAGLAPLQFEQMGSDQVQIRRGFMGLVLYYRDRSETLPVIKNVESLEYDLTSRIARMVRKNPTRIANVTGHQEIAWTGSGLPIAQDLESFYNFDPPLDLHVSSAPSLSGVQGLLIVGPLQPYDPDSLWTIDQAIMRGIPVAFLLDSKRFLAAQFMASPIHTGLEELLAHYGIKLSDQFVLDAQCHTVGMTQNLGGMSFTTPVRFPFIPLITNLNRKHPMMNNIDSVGLPFVSRLDPGKLPDGVRFTPMVSSSDKSWLAPSQTYNVAPNSIPPPKPGEPRGPFVVGALLEGSFPSYFQDKPSPVKGQTPIMKSLPTRIFVLGTSHVLDPKLPQLPGNDALMTNMLAWLVNDEALIGIQAKGEIVRPLKPIPPRLQDVCKAFLILGIPLLPILAGLLRWRRRNAWRKSIA